MPRDPVNLVRAGDRVRMVQPSTERDLTGAMSAFAERFLDSLGAVDGFILKSRSPSCGVRDARIEGQGAGTGLFAARVLERFPGVPVSDEAQLADERVRHDFLERVFAHTAERVERKASLSSGPHSQH